jgi:DNA-binding NarL/FixJ family response regulator
MYKILIADDHPLFREVFHTVITDGFRDSVVIESPDLDSVLRMTHEYEDLDLVLLDLYMPGMDGLNGLIKLRNEAPTIPVGIVSAEENNQVVLQAIAYGAAGYITKTSSRAQMILAIKQILNGDIYLPPDFLRSKNLVARRSGFRQPPVPPELLHALSPKQLKVLEHMTKGESNKQIAYRLEIAETTVKAHVSAILRTLRVRNRVQAVLNTIDTDFSIYYHR